MIQMKTYMMTLKRMMMTVLMMLMTVSAMSAEQKIWLSITGKGTVEVTTDKDPENPLKFTDGVTTLTDAGGQMITVSVKPESGYTVTSVTAQLTTDAGNADTRTDVDASFLTVKKASDIKYTFTMPKDVNVRISVTFESTSKAGGDRRILFFGDDYSGTYYIASDFQTPGTTNRNYDDVTLESNYYMCPTYGWIYYKPENNWSADGTTYPNPFLTTFLCRTDDYNSYGGMNNAKWIITKHGDYYSFYHTGTSQYMVFSQQISGCGADRMRVHLETISGDLPNKALFSIAADGRSITIHPYGSTDHLTVNGGNENDLKGIKGTAGKTGGPSGYTYTTGVIGIYRNADDNKYFYLEDFITRPTISYNSDNKIVITPAQTGTETITIKYTTDGKTPTSSYGNTYTEPFDPGDDVTTIKAIAIVNGEESNVAIFTPAVLLGQKHKRLIQSQNNPWNTSDFHFYMIPGDEASGILRVNTTSLFRPTMEWYFLYAGNDGLTNHYYYIVNNANSKYLCYDTDNGVYMDTNSNNADKFKFSIIESATTGSYNIVPYGLTTGNRFLNKPNGNGGNNADQAIGLSNSNTNINSIWKFVLPSSLDKTAPFTPSTANISYYKIASVGDNGYYIVSPTGSASNAMTSNSEDDDIVKTMNWFFEEAQEASSADWCTYYYIRNAVTGEYLYFTKDKNNDGACLEMRSSIVSAYEDRYLFTWARTATENTYYIVPKLLKDVEQNRISSLRKHDSNTSILTNVTRLAGRFAWMFSASTFQCADPVITYDATQGTATITCATPDAKIYYVRYTDDTGADPDLEGDKTGLTLYDGTPIDMSGYSYIKARAVRSGDGSDQSASVSEGPITAFKCATPVIKLSGGNISITCATTVATIYYTVNQEIDTTNPLNTTGIQTYSAPFPFDGTSVIRAIAIKGEILSNKSDVATYDKVLHKITRSSAITEMAGNYYFEEGFVDDRTDAIGTDATPFTGTIDGGYHAFSLSHPLIGVAQDATIKNVIISKANNISAEGNVGAIVNHAQSTTGGVTRIYNCGVLDGSVTGTGAVGGLVGKIVANSSCRVVNCFNYATVSGSSHAAGIVGRNDGTVGPTRIALCMMYGNITSGTVISPIYTGTHTSNSQNFTEYNFWRSKANLPYTLYNDQLAIDKDDYLTRYPFYRHILNTHRELATYILFAENTTAGSVADVSDDVSEIGHWVLNKDVALYPIVEEWKTDTKRTTVDIKNNLPSTTDERKGKLLTTMGNNNTGYLSVSVSINGTSFSASLPITDMNEDEHDYTWGKVVLPFANEFSGWTRDYGKVCTGWEITSVSGGETGAFAHYDMADRECTDKDLYAKSGFIFAQGGNYIVPYGVTGITITAHFANAFYLCDPQYEVGFDSDFTYANQTPLGGATRDLYNGQKVYHDLTTLVSALSTATNPHDQAIVLVGNFHYLVTVANEVLFNTGKAVTIMSTDDDNNQEPDYGWYMGNTYGRLELPPLRFDFVPIIELGMSSRVGNAKYPGLGIWHTRGWYEQTETCVSIRIQCEINSDNFTNNDDGKGNNRWVINSGYFEQIVRARDGACSKLSYIQIGGNACVKELYPGCHTDATSTFENPTVPIIVTGGEVKECYMSGYNSSGKLSGDMIYFWCAGGRINKFLGSYLEEPRAAGLTAKVDHALIGRFFGGGTSTSARIKGDIDITINNSQVDFYCGGPEFGNMESGKKVTTHATGTTFGEYYGAGYGGTSITYYREEQQNAINFSAKHTFPIAFSQYKRLTLKDGYGIGNCYKFEYIFHSDGLHGVARFYTGYAQFDLATTGNVTNILNNCTIKKLPGENSLTPAESSGDFYGAGCQGKVDGTVTSTLTDCTLEGNAFGGGYKAASNEVIVYPTTQPEYSVYTKQTGIFSDFGVVVPIPANDTYTWAQGDANTQNTVSGKTLYTSKDVKMNELGNVTGAITLTIDGGFVGGTAQGMTPAVPATDSTDAIPAGGSVYGGGNESKSLSNTTVTLKGDAVIYGDVFGGGNKAPVSGSTTVNIED